MSGDDILDDPRCFRYSTSGSLILIDSGQFSVALAEIRQGVVILDGEGADVNEKVHKKHQSDADRGEGDGGRGGMN